MGILDFFEKEIITSENKGEGIQLMTQDEVDALEEQTDNTHTHSSITLEMVEKFEDAISRAALFNDQEQYNTFVEKHKLTSQLIHSATLTEMYEHHEAKNEKGELIAILHVEAPVWYKVAVHNGWITTNNVNKLTDADREEIMKRVFNLQNKKI